MKFLIIDGYTDEPAGLGVPPYIGTYPRYVAGVIYKNKYCVDYITIDKLRELIKYQNFNFNKYNIIICICGFHTPGKYLNANPATLREFVYLLHNFNGIKILGGPVATKFGSSSQGGQLKDESKLKYFFDIVAEENLELVVEDLITNNFNLEKINNFNNNNNRNINSKEYYNKIKDYAVYGAKIIQQHPNYPYIVNEIETYRGCSRNYSGGCSFCTEPRRFGSPVFREVKDIINEIKSLSNYGAKYYRIGKQPCIYSYYSKDSEKHDIPIPNPEIIEKLFKNISKYNPEVLHIDNGNPAVISYYPQQCKEITKTLVKYCTSGNVVAFGVESFDEKVIKKNNLFTTYENVLNATTIVNEIGKQYGENGMPKLLPGINLLFGLKGETKETFEINYNCLKEIYNKDLLLRRINIRQVVPFLNTEITENDIKKAEKRKNLFKGFKEKVRKDIDNKMLIKMLPVGHILKNVFVELKEKDNLYFGRQFGSYPLLIGIESSDNLKIGSFVNVKITNYGRRSITGKIINIS